MVLLTILVCPDGQYGPKCYYNCTNCLNGTNGRCDPTDGKCKAGCVAGFMGNYCNISK